MEPTRRSFLLYGAAATAAVATAPAAADKLGLLPPDASGIWAPGNALNYAAHRLVGKNALAREFTREQISKKPFANGEPPKKGPYPQLQANNFVDWRLEVSGLVQQPKAFSLAELRAKPTSTQITHLACEEGWSYIAEWTGVPLSTILNEVQLESTAKYIVYNSMEDSWWDSIDIDEALHPQTQISHTMNGAALPLNHGGPLRMRVPRQLGYKSVKYLHKITVTDSLKHVGNGRGAAGVEYGYAWYNGI
jgi:DMSO/TMAO reductase YedYZ molybdopterin-dependent catalytic subunit